jgi:large subunit ribosomal protein L18e
MLISRARVERPPRMTVIIRKKNPQLARVIIELERAAKAHKAPVWRAAADRLARSRHQVFPLNVAHLERLAEPKQTILVPGKLLGEGSLTKPLTIGAISYSSEARSKVQAAGGTTLTILELLKTHADGKGVRLLA